MRSETDTFPVPMKRGGTMPMVVTYSVDFYNEPDGQGWEVEIESFHFSEKDKKDRAHLVDDARLDDLLELIGASTEDAAKDNGWRRPAPYPKYYYR